VPEDTTFVTVLPSHFSAAKAAGATSSAEAINALVASVALSVFVGALPMINTPCEGAPHLAQMCCAGGRLSGDRNPDGLGEVACAPEALEGRRRRSRGGGD